MKRATLLAGILALATLVAPHVRAQGETTMLPNGWAMTTRLRRLSDVNAVACSDDHAYAHGWSGGVVRWDGTRWEELPEPAGYTAGQTYGTRVAVTPSGNLLMEASGHVARWDGSSWTTLSFTDWPRYQSLGGIAAIGSEVLVVGRGRVARLEGTALRSYDAGTWRELSAIAGTSIGDLWTAGQGGTLMHWDGQTWTRVVSGTDRWLGGLLAVSANDVWAWAEDYGTPTLLHWDGHTWSPVTPPIGGAVLDVAVRGDRVWAVTAAGVFERVQEVWTSQLVPSDFGDESTASSRSAPRVRTSWWAQVSAPS